MNTKQAITSSIMRRGFTKAQANIIYRVYVNTKAIKIDVVSGGWSFAHGAFYEKAVMQTALDRCSEFGVNHA